MKLKRNVELLATNQRANLAFNQINSRLLYDNDSTIDRVLPSGSYQHLYNLSDEPIKEGDYYTIFNQKVYKCDYNTQAVKCNENKHTKKIIATTDKSLLLPDINFKNWDGKTRNLPSPSPEFIAAYIKAYNAGKPITDVMVEYTPTTETVYELGIDCSVIVPILKVDSNNYITITKVKDSWTREEVIALCRECFDDSCKYSSFKQWIEQNL